MSQSIEEMIQKFKEAKYEEIAEEKHLKASDGTKLRILMSKADKNKKNGYTLFLVPGWATIVPSWDEVLLEAMKDFDIIYLETREKKSSLLSPKAKFDLGRMSEDIKNIFDSLGLEKEKVAFLASSYGVLSVGEALAKEKIDPFLSVFIGALGRFDMPPFTRYLVPVIHPLFITLLKPVWRLWIRKAKSEDPEQAAKYYRALDEAEPKRWMKAARQVCFPWFWYLYEMIDNRVLLVGMEEDKMHMIEETDRIAELLNNCNYIDMKTNKNTHSSGMVEIIREEINGMEKEKNQKNNFENAI